MAADKIKNAAKTAGRILFIVLMLAAAGCARGSQQQELITIGVLLPLTGPDSEEGLRALNGLMLAREEINESGGILGKMLDLIILNDRGDEEYIVQQYNALREKGVAAIIGSSYSSATMALARAAERDGMPIISPTASNPDITLGRGNVFRAIFIDDYQAEVMAYFAVNYLNAQTALVLKNEKAASFARTAEVFSGSFSNFGGHVIAVERFSSEAEFADILRRYADNPPDVIYCPENFIPAAGLINTARELGFADTPFLGSGAWDGILPHLHNRGAVKNVFYTAPFSHNDRDENVMRFVRSYFKMFSQIPLSGSATSYTCVYILADAITRAGSVEAEDIISAMKAADLDMITGRILFDENNNPRINVYIITIQDGSYSLFHKTSLAEPGGLWRSR